VAPTDKAIASVEPLNVRTATAPRQPYPSMWKYGVIRIV
jgi:hypothetical protein